MGKGRLFEFVQGRHCVSDGKPKSTLKFFRNSPARTQEKAAQYFNSDQVEKVQWPLSVSGLEVVWRQLTYSLMFRIRPVMRLPRSRVAPNNEHHGSSVEHLWYLRTMLILYFTFENEIEFWNVLETFMPGTASQYYLVAYDLRRCYFFSHSLRGRGAFSFPTETPT